MKEKISLKKGVSLIVLLMTIAVMLILLTTITVSSSNIINNSKKRQFAKELYEIQNLVDKYKYENNDYPYIIENDENKTVKKNVENISNIFVGEEKVDNVITLYPVNLSKAGVENLSRGTNKDDNENDVYAFSEKTGKVYYVKGYKVGDDTYYTLTDELKELLGFKTQKTENSKITIVGESNILGEYVKYGLILHYDGIQNTRNGNNLNTTIWEDLSGNNNDGLFINDKNTILYKENGYEFTNNSDYIESKNNLGLSSDPNVTVEIVYKWYGGNWSAGFFNTSDFSITNGYSLGGWITANKRLTMHSVNAEVSSIVANENVINNISFVKKSGAFNNDTVSIYNNSIKDNSTLNEITTTMNFKDAKLQIGRGFQFGNNNRTLNGIIYAVRVYNRVLSEEEIKHNYEVDKARFNLK